MDNELNNEPKDSNFFNCEYFKKSLEKFHRDLMMMDDVITIIPKKDVIYIAAEIAVIKGQIEKTLEKKVVKII